MERLTNFQGNVIKCIDCVEQSNCESECDAIDIAINRLKDYENLNLIPTQIQEIDKLYAEKCKEVVELKEDISQSNNDCAGLSQENELFKAEIKQLKSDNERVLDANENLVKTNTEYYRKLKEQGRLIELPCKVGDTVYHLKFVNKCDRCEYNHPGKCKFDGKNVKCKENISEIVEKEFCLSMWSIYTEKLIHGFYSTRKEAEKALAKMESENER